jgi:hypothetical protein
MRNRDPLTRSSSSGAPNAGRQAELERYKNAYDALTRIGYVIVPKLMADNGDFSMHRVEFYTKEPVAQPPWYTNAAISLWVRLDPQGCIFSPHRTADTLRASATIIWHWRMTPRGSLYWAIAIPHT